MKSSELVSGAVTFYHHQNPTMWSEQHHTAPVVQVSVFIHMAEVCACVCLLDYTSLLDLPPVPENKIKVPTGTF